MNDAAGQAVTQILKRWSDGDTDAPACLMPLVYEDLRRRAAQYLRRERPDHTLQATALVHEAYLKLVDQNHASWKDRAHFSSVAAHLMRRILVQHARTHNAEKRGGKLEKLYLDAGSSWRAGSARVARLRRWNQGPVNDLRQSRRLEIA